MKVAWIRVVAVEVKKWLDYGYILKIELTGFADGLAMEWEKKVSGWLEDFGPRNCLSVVEPFTETGKSEDGGRSLADGRVGLGYVKFQIRS